MTICLTLHWWYLAAYLAIGCFLFTPLRWLVWRLIRKQVGGTFSDWLAENRPVVILGTVILWPLAMYQIAMEYRS